MDNVASYHNVDPTTGYLQATGNYAQAFTPERKQHFLQAYRESGLRFRQVCIKLGLSHDTVNHAYEIDAKFREDFKAAQADYAEELEARQRAYALEPKHFMDRAMQLRALFPGKYARDEKQNEQNVVINVSGNVVIDAKRRAESLDRVIEAEIAHETSSLGRLESASMGDNAHNNTHE